MSKLNYKTSKDYKRLKELLDKGEAVIVLHSGVSPHIARKMDGFKYCYTLGYLADSTERGFYRVCRILEVEFIEPNGEE